MPIRDTISTCMVLNLSISAEAEAKLKAKAAAAGVDVETYARHYVERLASPLPTLRELSGPIAEASGMDEDELAAFLEREKHDMRERQYLLRRTLLRL